MVFDLVHYDPSFLWAPLADNSNLDKGGKVDFTVVVRAMNYTLFPPNYEAIGMEFVNHYYKTLQTNRSALSTFYHVDARMSYEGTPIVGQSNINEKFMAIPAKSLEVALSSVDVHPAENAVLVFVCGQLRCDTDRPLSFSEVFYIRQFNNSFLISDSMFRLNLHNF